MTRFTIKKVTAVLLPLMLCGSVYAVNIVSSVSISPAVGADTGTTRTITSNGIPDYYDTTKGGKTSPFPNKGCPSTMAAHSYTFQVPISPTNPTSTTTPQWFCGTGDISSMPTGATGGCITSALLYFGVLINGVPLDPTTDQFYNTAKGTNDNSAASNLGNAWRVEGVVGAKRSLGLDVNYGHVQALNNSDTTKGIYHSHGIPSQGVASVKGGATIGYMIDGFPIIINTGTYQSSYTVKTSRTGTNAPSTTNPMGTYSSDFQYTPNNDGKHLDQCNGIVINGKYTYVLTSTFPFAPRCVMGTITPAARSSFAHPNT